jgi:hypothetical protein
VGAREAFHIGKRGVKIANTIKYSNENPLHLIERNLVIGPVVNLGVVCDPCAAICFAFSIVPPLDKYAVARGSQSETIGAASVSCARRHERPSRLCSII